MKTMSARRESREAHRQRLEEKEPGLDRCGGVRGVVRTRRRGRAIAGGPVRSAIEVE